MRVLADGCIDFQRNVRSAFGSKPAARGYSSAIFALTSRFDGVRLLFLHTCAFVSMYG